jgi:nicotinamide-nucleotide amidase
MTNNTTKQNTIVIIETLKERNESISFAESCTGGRIVAEFTAISGASSVLNGSAVTYSNEIKSQWLGVDEKIFIKHGAVSRECVNAMLKGIVIMAKSQHAIAVSGIAGPTGGTEEKPVGTVYLGVNIKGNISVKHHLFKGDRESVQEQATDTAIALFKNKL